MHNASLPLLPRHYTFNLVLNKFREFFFTRDTLIPNTLLISMHFIDDYMADLCHLIYIIYVTKEGRYISIMSFIRNASLHLKLSCQDKCCASYRIFVLKSIQSNMISRKRIVYSKEFVGEMKLTDFEVKTDEISVELAENGWDGPTLVYSKIDFCLNF